MKWILIFWIFQEDAGGPATAEFNSLAACESAVELVELSDVRLHTEALAFCAAKGSEE
jgi:hypothetical protein